VWTRGGGVWTQQGAKLVGLGAVGAATQGSSPFLLPVPDIAAGISKLARNEADKNLASAAVEQSFGHAQAALQNLDLAVRLDPSYAEAHRRRGSLRGSLGDYNGAVGDFDEAIRLDPKSAEAYRGRCFANLMLREHYSKAISDCSKALELNPQYVQAYRDRGLARLTLAEPRDAGGCSDLEKARALAIQQQVSSRQNPDALQRSVEDLFGSNSDLLASKNIALIELALKTLCE